MDRQNPEAWRCSLREVSVDADPYWTTCDNCSEETSEPSGPMRAVVGGMGKKGVPTYRRLPYLNGRRPEIVEPGGSGTKVIRVETEEETAKDFGSADEYLGFQEEHEQQWASS
ncbi:hypothetical protein [Salinibacter ruber]|uniref:Uncharacterized protein n=1 Tax=Salinibacter ruber TaxID=146919 RepID=A0A9X2UBP3_9BACT|nr:hypothetical protein [Salinibacter ruber]MBB4062508.1 hypothetical protein [Salinibacter ruber]MCS3705021.1 hypothetical protein [Salinibacter ruber]MCS3953368.1 hypothetical protein [Salinibacter ruber]MCS4054089.1 hypothetical protein [Salinibacter ruber]MCS4184665.1 hypothetical protein [Salinibacter ruber]